MSKRRNLLNCVHFETELSETSVSEVPSNEFSAFVRPKRIATFVATQQLNFPEQAVKEVLMNCSFYESLLLLLTSLYFVFYSDMKIIIQLLLGKLTSNVLLFIFILNFFVQIPCRQQIFSSTFVFLSQ